MKKKKQKGAWKRPVASVLGMVLVIGLTILGTLAFLQTESNTKTNVFTGSNDIKLYLEEPDYNLREIKDTFGNIIEATKDPDELDPREYVPGMTYPKDPTLYNITGMQKKKNDGTTEEYAEEWVAMRVDYAIDDGDADTDDTKTYAEMIADYEKVNEGDPEQATSLKGIIDEIAFDVDGTDENGDATEGSWIRLTKDNCDQITENEKYEIYVYKYRLKASDTFDEDDIKTAEDGATVAEMNTMDTKLNDISGSVETAANRTAATTPLFQNITIKDQNQLIKNGYDIANLKKFTIQLKGAAIKVMPTIDIDKIVDSEIKQGTNSSKAASQLIVEDLVSLLIDSTD